MAVLGVLAVVSPVLSDSRATGARDALGDVPRLVLWAWERPEDLRFLHSENAAVAFLAGTADLRGAEVKWRPRFQPLRVAEETKLIAVTRIEAARGAELGPVQAEEMAERIASTGEGRHVVAVQVDFDATESQREFYGELLVRLRRKLPASLPISITALASWCEGDTWVRGLPIDEAVPMLFRMGVGRADFVARMNRGEKFRERLCRDSLGVSIDEPWKTLPGGKRVYVFDPRAWTETDEQAFLWEAHSWR
jgi:hypothetical protein